MRSVLQIIVSGLLFLNFSSCAFNKLNKEVETLNQTSLLQGIISNPSPHQKPLIVLVYQLRKNERKLVSYAIYHVPGTFTFIRSPGRYLIAAFEDANEDLMYQPTEYAGYANNAMAFTVRPNEDHLHVDLTLRNPGEVVLLEVPDLTSPSTKAELDLPHTRAGEIITLKDPRLSLENGQLGLWEPIQFLVTVGGGIYFLEPFDPEKIPVLFVHGVGGYSKEISSLIRQIDRTQFQPWIFLYPSGLRLDLGAEFLRQSLSKILIKNKFHKLVLIAHSMGGLVSRDLLNTIVQKDTKQQFKVLFLTLSTPWGGHQAAEIGVEYAPAVIPSWMDMIPNSPFQQALFQTSLSDNIEYYLFFSFKGGRNPFINGNDDGTVSLISQLKPEAQEAAIKTFGFNEDHMSILLSQEVTEKIGRILSTFARAE